VRPARSTPAVLAVPAAVLAGHGLGYLLAGSGHGGSHALHHGYLPAVALVAAPALAVALVVAAVASGRPGAGRRHPAAHVPFLVRAQWTVFLAQEVVEHAVAGDALGVVGSPALWLGLAAQVAVAAATGLLLTAASWAGGRAVAGLGSVPRWPAPAREWPMLPVGTPVADALLVTASPRGPPRRRR
jgi:hypothetical protein